MGSAARNFNLPKKAKPTTDRLGLDARKRKALEAEPLLENSRWHIQSRAQCARRNSKSGRIAGSFQIQAVALIEYRRPHPSKAAGPCSTSRPRVPRGLQTEPMLYHG